MGNHGGRASKPTTVTRRLFGVIGPKTALTRAVARAHRNRLELILLRTKLLL